MNIYIPSHLRKLRIVDQLYRMMHEYITGELNDGVGYGDSEVSSFDDYQYMLKLDPVKKFISMCITEDDLPESQDYESVVNYLSHLFYSVKGTAKVFEYMKKYFTRLHMSEDIIYSTSNMSISIDYLEVGDQGTFEEALMGFIDALVYTQEVKKEIGRIKLIISETIKTDIGCFAVPYKNNVVSEEFDGTEF